MLGTKGGKRWSGPFVTKMWCSQFKLSEKKRSKINTEGSTGCLWRRKSPHKMPMITTFATFPTQISGLMTLESLGDSALTTAPRKFGWNPPHGHVLVILNYPELCYSLLFCFVTLKIVYLLQWGQQTEICHQLCCLKSESEETAEWEIIWKFSGLITQHRGMWHSIVFLVIKREARKETIRSRGRGRTWIVTLLHRKRVSDFPETQHDEIKAKLMSLLPSFKEKLLIFEATTIHTKEKHGVPGWLTW